MSTPFRSFLLALLAACTLGLQAQEGTNDPTFNPSDSGQGIGLGAQPNPVNAVAVQADGKAIIVGQFNFYNDRPRSYVARTNLDGTLDLTFDPGSGATSNVNSVVIQPDGKLLIGGLFTTFNAQTRNRVARLNGDGSVDPSFTTGLGADSDVNAIARQSDGKILIAGNFTTYASTDRNRIARLSSTGTLDPTFLPGTGANDVIRCMAVQADGKIFIGGTFTSYNGTACNRVARLNSDGSFDATFAIGSGADDEVRTMLVQPDGKILLGGNFSSFNGTTDVRRLFRLLSNGSVDTGFDAPTALASVSAMVLLPDGKIVFGGASVRRIFADGSFDATYQLGSGPSHQIYTLALQPDGKVIAGGLFFSFDGHPTTRLARLNSGGGVDLTFNPQTGANEWIHAAALQQNGKCVIGGEFIAYNGVLCGRVARTNVDGSLDASFNPGGSEANGDILTMVVLPDDKILIGGQFSSYNGTPRARIARLNINGTLDATFNPGSGTNPAGYVETITVQPDGKIIIGGWFTSYNGVPRNRVARLNSDGSLDTSFDPGPGPNDYVYASAVLPDGKILIGGRFSAVNGTTRFKAARLHADGSLDLTFDPAITGSFSTEVRTCYALPDGEVLIGGSFNNRLVRLNTDGSVDAAFGNGTGPNDKVMRIVPQPDGRWLIAGFFTSYNSTPASHIARLLPSGQLDASFNAGTDTGNFDGIVLQTDGSVVIYGRFGRYNGVGRNSLARALGTPRTNIRVMLEGPYAGVTMTDALRTLPSFPLTEPFTAMGYAETGYVAGASIGSSVLSVTGNNAIVDWVLVEMRPVATPGTVATSRAVLLQRDGDVVDLDGVSTVGFAGLAAGNCCVAVKPRNHLPVMLSATTPVSYGAAIATVDFTLPTTQVHDNDARKNVGGVMVLAAGDVTFNETMGYTGAGNDRDPILTRVGSTTPNVTVSGYWREDVNMDGVVKYTGSANDRDIILTNVGSTTPNYTRVATLP